MPAELPSFARPKDSPTSNSVSGCCSGALLEAAIKPGDRVAYLGVNTHRLMEAYYGVLEAGAILLPLNIRLAPAELSFVLNDAGATVLFIEQPFIPLVDSFRQSLHHGKKVHPA